MVKNFILSVAIMASISTAASAQKVTNNLLSENEKNEGFKLLFDGKSTKGWHLYNQGKISSAWLAINGELRCVPGTAAAHGDLVTDEKFQNYELRFDWKISKEGNSGVFINVLERKDIPTAWASGPEYQLLDSKHYDYAKELKRSGCLYGFSKQLNAPPIVAAGGWNHSIIRQQNGKVQFFLNGVLTAEQDFTTEQWKKAIAATSFSNFPEFGKQTSGQISLQDWNKGVAFKNIKIKNL
ncbi:DUF1080 domain-containing protein [Pedobacter aquatilis]|uniref:3-keto-disaccharide hydrolase n=1 Tax=Pedobacter aquatilis TaxID=351343 RepID=UPI00292D3348|nr:DUF1080 domain-containing protein [Pedobacter aquatilis]